MKREITNNRIAWVDAIKGIAMLLILMMHTGSDKGADIFSMSADHFFFRLGGNGWIGVVLFFLISGFLLYQSLYTLFCKNNYSVFVIFNWIKRKFIRFIPLFYLALFIGFIWHAHYIWLKNIGQPSYENLFMHILFLHGFFPNYCANILGVEWYIGVLAIFICIVPFLFKYINSLKKSIIVFIVSIPITYLITTYLNTLKPTTLSPFVYQNYLNAFGIVENVSTLLLGIVLYHVYHNLPNISIRHKVLVSYILLAISFILLIQNLYTQSTVLLMNTHTVWGIIFSLFIVSQMIHENYFICYPFLKLIGQYSWPIYLFHFFIIHLYRKYQFFDIKYPLLNWFIEFTVIVCTSLLLSMILVKYFDKPLVSYLSKKLTSKQK